MNNGKVRRVKIGLAETKQLFALNIFQLRKTEDAQKQFQIFIVVLSLNFRLPGRQLRSLKNLNLVLEYERGGECTQSDATDFELFSIPLHFPHFENIVCIAGKA